MAEPNARGRANPAAAKQVPDRGQRAERRDQSERFRNGMAFRRLIHGADHVDRAWDQARDNEQRAALEEFITECIWGTIWSRNGLPTKTRSLITIALLVATHQGKDLLLHMRSAVLRNDCTLAELREVVLHAAAYCGVPSAVAAFELTDQLAAELATQGSSYVPEGRHGNGRHDKS